LQNAIIVVLFVSTALILLGSLNQEAFAVNKSWDGGAGSNSWSDGDNWDPDGVPASGDDITIGGTADVDLDKNHDINSMGSLTIANGARLTIIVNNQLRNNGQLTNNGDLIVDGKLINQNTLDNTNTGTIDALGTNPKSEPDKGFVGNEGIFTNDGKVKNEDNLFENKKTLINQKVMEFKGISIFKNKDKGTISNKAGAKITFDALDWENTGESTINNSGTLTITGITSKLTNKLLSTINNNDGGVISITDQNALLENNSKLNNNGGAKIELMDGILDNLVSGIIKNEGSGGKKANIIVGKDAVFANDGGKIDNNNQGFIEIKADAELVVASGSFNNNPGSELIIRKGAVQNGKINLLGGIFINMSKNSIINFGIINIQAPFENFGTIQNHEIIDNGGFLQNFDTINNICEGKILGSPPDPLGIINQLPCPQVGGVLIPIDTTALLLAGAQMNAAWMIPVIVSAIGFAIVILRKL